MLTETLRSLQRDGLIDRTVFPTTPPSVEYRLTALGASLLDPMRALVAWADAQRTAISRAGRLRSGEGVTRACGYAHRPR